jgi:hypothetical protein
MIVERMRGGSFEVGTGDGARDYFQIPPDATGGVCYRDVTISSAELLALNATPKELVPAPGAGFALVLDGVVAHKPANDTAYDGIAAGEDISIRYTDGSGTELAEIEATGFLDQTTVQTRFAYPYRAASGVSSVTPTANAAIVAHMLTGEIATGDGDLKMRVFYRILPTTLS